MLAVLPATGLCIMTRLRHRIRIAALAALPLLLLLLAVFMVFPRANDRRRR